MKSERYTIVRKAHVKCTQQMRHKTSRGVKHYRFRDGEYYGRCPVGQHTQGERE